MADPITENSPVTMYAIIGALTIFSILFAVGRFYFFYVRDNVIKLHDELNDEREKRHQVDLKVEYIRGKLDL